MTIRPHLFSVTYMTNSQTLKNWNKAHAALQTCPVPNWSALILLAMVRRNTSLRQLAAIMKYSPTYVSQVRTGKQSPSPAFAKRLEEVI